VTAEADDPGFVARLRFLLRSVRFKALSLAAGMLVAVGLVGLGTAVEVSSQPRFCGSCHIMTPYYESWKQSTHHDIACVECHIPPGVTAEIRKKWEALSMVARYFTGTYGTNPWTEIDDASCLRCHERRLLSGKEMFGDVLFDHAAHLTGMRRGKTLRCTSCHGQIVQGSHIAVTASTCILCHFKNTPSNTGTARCTLCHRVPEKEIRTGDVAFNHADVGRYGMECTHCHERPAGSDGEVPRERCLTCHNQADRLEKYGDTEFLHQMHVADHKVDCVNCHLTLQHVARPHVAETADEAKECSSCHQGGHSPQQALYAGTGGRGVDPMPDPMFLAGVRCEGCHLAIPGREDGPREASAIGCMSCHGPTFNKVFLSWQSGLAARTAGLRRQVDQTASALGGPAPAGARHNLDFVVKAGGVHNIRYAYALLRRAHDDLNAARQQRGLSPLPLPWHEVPVDSPCLSCHIGIEDQSGSIFGRSFSHAPHLMKAKLDCAACHRTHAERERGEVVRFDLEGCVSCHHGGQPLTARCLACHSDIKSRTVTSRRGRFSHSLHLDSAGLDCGECHQGSESGAVTLKTDACATCHEGG
jgi:nitrate/TMAO reductase-like tetraheme cytochrome c subunit